METGFAVTAFLSLFLNLVIPEEDEDEAVDITANNVDASDDEKEWERIRRPSQMRKSHDIGTHGEAESTPSDGAFNKEAETSTGEKNV